MSRLIRAAALAAVLTVAQRAAAQTCEPPETSNEAGIFGSRSLALAFGRGIAGRPGTPGTVRLGAEVAVLPRISDEDARPTACRPGKGPENVNALPLVGRVRVAVALPGRVALDAAWLPPVPLEGTRGNLLGLALSRTYLASPNISLVARLHAVVGAATGPFTCSGDDVRDETSECFGGTVSEDRYRPNIFGADLSADWTRPASQMTVFGGAGYTRLAPRFQVHFRNAQGGLDSTLVRTDLGRIALFGGVGRAFGDRWRAGGEVYATLDDGATIRVVVDALVRRGARGG